MGQEGWRQGLLQLRWQSSGARLPSGQQEGRRQRQGRLLRLPEDRLVQVWGRVPLLAQLSSAQDMKVAAKATLRGTVTGCCRARAFEDLCTDASRHINGPPQGTVVCPKRVPA